MFSYEFCERTPFLQNTSTAHLLFDDNYISGHTFSACEDNVNAPVDLLQFLGCTIHPEKSVLVPTQEIEFLRFVLNSVKIKINRIDCKSDKVISKTKKLLHKEKQTPKHIISKITGGNP